MTFTRPLNSPVHTLVLTYLSLLLMRVSLTNDGSISTDLYTKPADKHQHLLYSSCHSLHDIKTAIPFSLALLLRRICSTDAMFNTRAARLSTYLCKRGFKRNSSSSPNKYDAPPTSSAHSLYKPKTSSNLTCICLLSVAFRRFPNLRDLIVTARLSTKFCQSPTSSVLFFSSVVAKNVLLAATFLTDLLQLYPLF